MKYKTIEKVIKYILFYIASARAILNVKKLMKRFLKTCDP